MPRRAQHLTQMQVAVNALHRNPIVVDGLRGLSNTASAAS